MGSLQESIKVKLEKRVGEARAPLKLKLEELQSFIETGAEMLPAIYEPNKARRRALSRDRHLPSHSHSPCAVLDTASPRRCALT